MNTDSPTDRQRTAAGHLSIRLDGRDEPSFQLAQQPRRLFLSMVTTFLIQAGIVIVLYFAGRAALQSAGIIEPEPLPFDFIYVANQPGPGGGGGGGGNRMPDPPKRAEAKGPAKITVPAKPPESVQVKLDPPPAQVPQIDVPVRALESGTELQVGTIQGLPSLPTASQGSGSGGGVGTGVGTGIGPGRGSGLGPGSGGGMGGGVYRPGSGVNDPELLVRRDPIYTSEAAEKRIEGIALVKCIVTTKGRCTDIHITRSLDQRYGLDMAAVKAVEQWVFKPAIRKADNQPVNMEVIIEVAFSIR